MIRQLNPRFDNGANLFYNLRTVVLDGALAIPCSQHSLYWR